MKKRILWLAVLVLLVAAGVGAWLYREKHRPPEVVYKTAPVEKRHIVGKVTASGTLSALVTVQVGTQVSGRVQKLFADFNSQVKKGELVAKIDPQLFEASVQQAQANYLQAKAGVVTAQANAHNADLQYARTKALKEAEPRRPGRPRHRRGQRGHLARGHRRGARRSSPRRRRSSTPRR